MVRYSTLRYSATNTEGQVIKVGYVMVQYGTVQQTWEDKSLKYGML